jgi:hypothetical protein
MTCLRLEYHHMLRRNLHSGAQLLLGLRSGGRPLGDGGRASYDVPAGVPTQPDPSRVVVRKRGAYPPRNASGQMHAGVPRI